MVAKEQAKKLIEKFGASTLAVSVNSLPRSISLMSGCTGSGMLELVAHALIAEMNAIWAGDVCDPICVTQQTSAFDGFGLDCELLGFMLNCST